MNSGDFREADGAKFYRLQRHNGRTEPRVSCFKKYREHYYGSSHSVHVSVSLECQNPDKPCSYFAGYDVGEGVWCTARTKLNEYTTISSGEVVV
jgi:hypothetical protein